ncbi:hypothetical protein, partial [Streptomyces sp. NPDC006879]|uniref:hypothetical protein n=1 Tax=Streptomyces sp. NPDC006879 TaxID=3364767 RepID=UPI0036AC75BD
MEAQFSAGLAADGEGVLVAALRGKGVTAGEGHRQRLLNLNSCCRSAVHDQVCAGEAAVDQVWAVLDLLELAFDG